jgi:hypothetical protein
MQQGELPIALSDKEKILLLRETLEKLGKHSLYCGWVHDGGYYDRKLGCTCGLQEALDKTA